MYNLSLTLFGVRCQAMAHAMQTAVPGEPITDIMVRASLIAGFMSEPLLTKHTSDGMGEPVTARVQ